ncbi:MAG: S41 family peptidase [Bacteroidales bacterium]|nr:S41 family peptidase [Bacteroidales bacterium]
MKTAKYTVIAALMLLWIIPSGAQSKGFRMGKWIEIQTALLQQLNMNYVDSLPIDRIERAGIDAMLENLDPYTVYIPEEENEDLQMMLNKSYGGIGAIIYKPDKNGNVLINEPYKGSPAEKYGLRCGDEILAIDGVSTHGLTASESSDRMKGKPGTKVTFKVKKVWTGDTVDVVVLRERIHLPDVEYYGMLNDTTGYILQTGFTENVAEDVRSAFLDLKSKGMKVLYYDLRGNGGGLLSEAVKIVSLFVPKGSTVVSQKGNNNSREMVYKTVMDPVDTRMPIVVLVNSGTASASEIVSGALQDLDRATIMGQRTFGKGLVQGIQPLPYNGQLKVTIAKYYTPSGRCVQAIDYAHRNEDGSVGHIPDSLTHEFTTVGGRKVRDGGGITPDDTLKAHSYSRLTYSLVVNGIIEQYAMKYVSAHRSITPVESSLKAYDNSPSTWFRFGDEEYSDFVQYAKGRDFDYRSSARALFDQMKEQLEKDGLAENMSSELEALRKALEMDKEQFLLLKKDEIIPFIEEEIAVRYFWQTAGIQVRLRYDDALREALTKQRLF